jgi:predicted DNA binding protein
MVISTRVYAEHPNLALVHTIRTCEDAQIGVVSDAGTDPQHDVHVFWIEASDFEEVERALAEDSTVADFKPIVEKGNRRTYQIEYTDEAALITPAVNRMGGIVRETESHTKGWNLRLEFRDHESLYQLHEYARENDIRLDMLDVRQQHEADDGAGLGLTDAQVEALVCAHVHGFYDEPREISLEGLAEILGISQTAVSGRLRRGATRLIEEILIENE